MGWGVGRGIPPVPAPPQKIIGLFLLKWCIFGAFWKALLTMCNACDMTTNTVAVGFYRAMHYSAKRGRGTLDLDPTGGSPRLPLYASCSVLAMVCTLCHSLLKHIQKQLDMANEFYGSNLLPKKREKIWTLSIIFKPNLLILRITIHWNTNFNQHGIRTSPFSQQGHFVVVCAL